MSCLCCLGYVPSKDTIIYPSKWPSKPWDCMRIGFFEKSKLNFLIAVDAFFQVIGGNPHEFYDQLENH